MTQALMGVAESTAFNTPSGRNSLSGTPAEGLEWPAPWGVYCSVGGVLHWPVGTGKRVPGPCACWAAVSSAGVPGYSEGRAQTPMAAGGGGGVHALGADGHLRPLAQLA